MSTIAVIDYGMGNLHSVAKALELVSEEGTQVLLTADPQKVRDADRVLLPGVGAIRDCVAEMRRLGVDQEVREAISSGKPFLGICVGYQALTNFSEENGGVECLSEFDGRVNFFGKALKDDNGDKLKVPHMGWNQVQQRIDLKDGKCVRLRQGRMDDSTVFSDNPVDMAAKWVDAGCRRLHLVDLNGAFAGEPVNGGIVREIAKAYPDLPIQIGGGIRSAETIEAYLDAGVTYVIIGTKAVKEPEFVTEMCKAFPGNIIVGLDAQDGRVAIDGWAEVTDVMAVDLAKRFRDDEGRWEIFTHGGQAYRPRCC